MRKNMAIVVDRLDSALGIAANRRAKIVNADVIGIVNFRSPKHFFEFLELKEYDFMVFSWRRGLLEAMSSNGFRNFIARNRHKTKIGLVIADYLGLEKRYLDQERSLINYVDGYWTTNHDLFAKYSHIQGVQNPIGVLHDIPDFESIERIRNRTIKKRKIIWVGNSNWGVNYGFHDYKGFHEIIEPVFEKAKRTLKNYEFCIIDSKKNPMNNLEVLMHIAESKIILQASVNEGTGLPLLEGLGLGTIPISTDVGVASELLTGNFKQLLVARNFLDFEEKILEIVNEDSEKFNKINEMFDYHISKIVKESMKFIPVTKNDQYAGNKNLSNYLKNLLLWNYRYYKSRKSHEN